MELSCEVYSWLSEVLDTPALEPTKSSKEMVKLPQHLISELLCGMHMTKILNSLQEAYNKFYQLNLNYTAILHELKFKRNISQMDSNMKYSNWKLIGDALLNFGIIFDESHYLSLAQGNIGVLKEVLSKVYLLSNELMRKSIQPGASTFIESPLPKEQDELRSDPNNNEKAFSSLSKPRIEESNFNDQSSLNISNAKAFNDVSKISAISRQSNTSNAIDINTLDITKDYLKCESPLEFFVVSLCKVFCIQTRQAVALLSNNRKYLTVLFYKGIKGSFDAILQWIHEVTSNMKALTDLLRLMDNNKGIGYATVGVGLYSKSSEVSSQTLKALELIRRELGTDHDWIKSEGIDLFIYAINKHDCIRSELIMGMHNLIKDIVDDFIEQLKAKYYIKEEKNTVISFIMTLIPHFSSIPTLLESKLFNWISEMCLSPSQSDKSFSLSLLTELWAHKESYSSIDNDTKAAMMTLYKSAIRDQSNRLSLSAISLLFSLMDRFAEHRSESGPMIYKTIVFLFLENYDNDIKREHLLISFSHFYFKKQNVPLGIFLEPYLNQLLSVQSFHLCDFAFLSRILCHPRIQPNHLKLVIEFSLTVSLNNIYYSRSACLLFIVVFNNRLLNQSQEAFNEGVKLFTTHIQSVLSLYLDNIKNGINDNEILEALFDILIEKIPEINDKVKANVINAVQVYRKVKGKHTNGLLSLLWFYLEHDDVLLRLEEDCAVIPKSTKKAKDEVIALTDQPMKEKSFKTAVVIETKKNTNTNQMKHSVEEALVKIQKQKEEKVSAKREEMLKRKIKEQKLQRSLEKQLAKKSLALGIHSVNQSKLSTENQLIQNEGSLINNTTIKLQRKPINKMKLNTLIDFNSFNFLISLSEEEDREQKAIDVYTRQYKKRLKTLFKGYITNESFLISKPSILKMLRDKAFINTDITLDELSFGIRNCFGHNLNEVAFDQFSSLLITLSSLIYSKKNRTYTISECYYHLLKSLLPSSNGEGLINRDKHKLVISFLKACINSGIDFLYPPGFKKTEEMRVVYKTAIPKTFNKYLIEPYRISLMIVNEVIEQAIGCHILEPFLKVKPSIEIDIDPGAMHKWSNPLAIAYSKLDPSYNQIGIEVADCIEDMMTQLLKGRDKMGNIILHPNAIKEIKKTKKATEIEAKKDEIRQKRMKEIKELADQYKKDKEEKKRQKEAEKEMAELEKKREFHEQLVSTKKKNKQVQEELSELKKKKEEEEQAKSLLDKQIKHEEKLKSQEEKSKFFKNYNRRLKEQFKIIKTQKETITKKKLEKLPINQKLPEVQANYLSEDKAYCEFEKNLTFSMETLRDRPDIRAVFDKYNEHLRTVFDIYVKIGRNKLSAHLPEEAIQSNEYKEFLVNFTVFGLLISPEQMNFVFKKLSRKTGDNQLTLCFDDFKTSLMYLIIMSRFTDKSIIITPSDLEQLNEQMAANFFAFLGFALPFEKREIENMINTRRGMSAKAFFEFQLMVKKEKVDLIKDRKLMPVKSKTRMTSANATRKRGIDSNNNNQHDDINANRELIKSNSESHMKEKKINGADQVPTSNEQAYPSEPDKGLLNTETKELKTSAKLRTESKGKQKTNDPHQNMKLLNAQGKEEIWTINN